MFPCFGAVMLSRDDFNDNHKSRIKYLLPHQQGWR